MAARLLPVRFPKESCACRSGCICYDGAASRPRHTVEHQKSAAGDGDVGHVERRPVERAAVDVQEVGDRAVVRTVEEVAERTPHDEADADGAGAVHWALGQGEET